jgi:ArsR family transcriptional regulator
LSTHTPLGARPRNGRAARAAAVKAPPADTPAGGQVDDDTIKEMCDVFKMLSDPSRLKILLALAQNGQMHVSALRDLLDQSQPAVSHHLSLMRHTRLVRCDRQGKHNFYRLDADRVSDMIEQLFGEVGNGAKQIHFEDFALSLKRK